MLCYLILFSLILSHLILFYLNLSYVILISFLGIEKSVAMWICTSIKPKTSGTGGKYEWGFNLTMIDQLFNDFCDTDMWSFLENYNGNGNIHFVRAGKNPSWTEKVLDRFKTVESNKNILLHVMPDVGHWIHAEDLNGMFKIISKESGLSQKNNFD